MVKSVSVAAGERRRDDGRKMDRSCLNECVFGEARVVFQTERLSRGR
jgi:hypothetical protein